MGNYDIVVIKCWGCKRETNSQTKILGRNHSSFGVGDEIINDEFANCIFRLKDNCLCGNYNAIIIENKKIMGVTNPKYATCIEKAFGDYEWVDEFEKIVKEKLRKIEGKK